MTRLADAIVIDTAELRAAAAALREAERDTVELGLRLPREVWGAPDWLASSAADGLALARRQLDELGADLRAESKRLGARAVEVDSAEQRWWEIGSGGSRCGCVLPSGTIVAQPGQSTAASSASGPGIGDAGAFIGVGAISAAAAAGLGVSVIGGGGGSDLLVDGRAPGSGFGVSVIGGASDSLFTTTTAGSGEVISVIGGGGDSLFYSAPTAPTAGSGEVISWGNMGGDSLLGSASEQAAFAHMADLIFPGGVTNMMVGGSGGGGMSLDIPGARMSDAIFRPIPSLVL